MLWPIKNAINNEYGVLILDNPPCYASHAYRDDLDDSARTRWVACSQFGQVSCSIFSVLGLFGLHVTKKTKNRYEALEGEG